MPTSERINIDDSKLSDKLETNLNKIKNTFSYPMNTDLIIRELYIKSVAREAVIIFLEGMTEKGTLERNIITTLITQDITQGSEQDIGTILTKKVLTGKKVRKFTNYTEVIHQILRGYSILLIDNYCEALSLSAEGFEHRAIEKPTIENILKGPKESFTESGEINRSLVRKHLRDANLITESMLIGERGGDEVYIMYIKDIVNTELLNEVKRRVEKIKIDNMDNNIMLEQYIEDRTYSLIPSTLITERPDRAAAFLREGHIVIFTANGSVALIVPITIWTLFHSAEDQYLRWPYGNFIRLVRYFSCLTALLVPAFYMAITTYHQQMIPLDLVMAITASREKLPFPVLVEILVMEISFELIREAGIRIPTAVGPTIGILGTLILGQAAVEANIISPVLVIVVSITGLSSFAIPDISLGYMIRIGRFIFLAAAAAGGFLGLALLLTVSVAYMSTLESFGVPYFAPYSPYIPSSGDLFIRPSVWKKFLRPLHVRPKDEIRENNEER